MCVRDKKLVLVDGSSYLYRAYYALPQLSNSSGEPTGALYGVVNMLHKLLSEEADEHIAVVFDAPGRTFRDDLFEQYKAHRPPMPDELRSQLNPLKEIISALGIPVVEVAGVEADDVIGTLARRSVGPVLISTGDKDMAQLVDERVTLLNTMTGRRLDPAGVEERFGVPPEAVRDYLALVGDKSDNIPGIPKVGEKTAAKWLQEYGNIAALRENADEIKGKVGESLRAHLNELELSVNLATIRCDLDLDVSPPQLLRQSPDNSRLRELYRRYEMRRLLKELEPDSPEHNAKADMQQGPESAGNQKHGVNQTSSEQDLSPDYQLVTDEQELDVWIASLKEAEAFAFDLETDSLSYMDAAIVGFALAVKPHQAAYVPVAHDYDSTLGQLRQLSLDYVLARLRPLLEDDNQLKVGQNLKYDMSVLARYGIDLRGVAYDTMLESYVLDSTATRHDMDSLAWKYLGVSTTTYEDLCGKGAKQKPFASIDVHKAKDYAAEDADITLRLHQKLLPRLKDKPSLFNVFSQLEMPLVPVLSRMERGGVKVDQEMLGEQSKELAERMSEVESLAHSEAGEEFNLNSPRQIQEILFERMGLPVEHRTPKGQPSTAEAVLEELRHKGYELPRLILEHRGWAKLKSTYTDKLPRLIHPQTGRVHTSYHQAVAATGRLSSSDPNLQNIPIRSEAGRKIRQAFIAEPGYSLVTADYSQVELRIMAHLSADEGLQRAFAAGEDIHRSTAAEVFGVEHPSDEQRRAAKAINFGLIYGMSAWGLGRQLNIERELAQLYIDRYFERYPGVREFMAKTREQARERGYVETVFGRRLYLPEISSRNRQRREYAERTAINAPMQGTAADIIKQAMIDVDAMLSDKYPGVHMVMQVHDELVLEIPQEQIEPVSKRVQKLMAAADQGALTVPLEVEIGVGRDWDEAH
ncbi:DNA polymerase I [Halorhodospira halochloris]|uniref:DNA polymerase I n=1 Tax=Halorhodospira halochloris TaxID=1052 RepID=A0A110B4S5_HALHR|nr:DNA polymerase I [Halorhodospira halochloris]MBK1650854.1 DNA polymerase I [Halorhodospira halochloris]BAU56648.1 DNA polymerase I [Halorhodospira halochloris]